MSSQKIIFHQKPEIKKTVEVIDKKEICSYEGRPVRNSSTGKWLFHDFINLGDETVSIVSETFDALTGDWTQEVDYVIENTDINKERAEGDLLNAIKEYNRTTIENEERLSSYCNVHHLDPEETDVDELRKIVYGETNADGVKVSYAPDDSYSFLWTAACPPSITNGWGTME